MKNWFAWQGWWVGWARRPLSVVVASLLVGGCYSTNSYVLRIDAEKPANSQLCEVESASAAEPSCQPLAGQTLDSPGVLALEVTNSTVDKEYSFQIAETRLTAPSAPAPNEVIQEVATRLTGLSKDFVGRLDRGNPHASEQEAKSLLLEVSKKVAPRQPAAAAALDGLAAGLARKGTGKRTQAEAIGNWLPWIDEATLSWRTLAPGDPREPPPRGLEYEKGDTDYIAERANKKDPKTGQAAPEKLTGPHLASFTVAWCKPESFGTNRFTGELWVKAVPPWSEPAELMKKLALEPKQIEDLVKSGKSKLSDRIGALLDEADKATPEKPPSEAAKALYYLLTVSRIAAELRRCEHNLASFSGLPAADAKVVAETLVAVQEARQRLQATADAEDLFEDLIAPFAVSAAVRVLTQRSQGGTLTFGTYTLHPGRLALSATTGSDEQPEVISKQEFVVKDVGPVAVSVGPFVSWCDGCVHSVTERFTVGSDAAGNPTVTRSLEDDTKSASIGVAAMLHYTLFGDTKNQVGLALGYPLRDQTGTALGVLSGLSWRNTVGLQAGIGAHVFETRHLKSGEKSGVASTRSVDDATEGVPTVAGFFFLGATSDLLVKP